MLSSRSCIKVLRNAVLGQLSEILDPIDRCYENHAFSEYDIISSEKVRDSEKFQAFSEFGTFSELLITALSSESFQKLSGISPKMCLAENVISFCRFVHCAPTKQQ